MIWKIIGVVLVPLTIAVGLTIPASSTSGITIPIMFVVSGALIGRWWAPLPSLTAVVGLNLGELAGIGHSGAISLHAHDFALSFLLLTSAIAVGLAAAGALARWGVWVAIRQLRGVGSAMTWPRFRFWASGISLLAAVATVARPRPAWPRRPTQHSIRARRW